MIDALNFAYECLSSIYREKSFSSITLNETLNKTSKDDKKLVTKIVYGVLDKDIELDYIINKFTSSVKPAILPIIKIGVYCLKYLSIPDYALVNECVNLTKKIGKTGISGFVNAVLKNIAKSIKEEKIEYPKSFDENLSIRYSYPLWAVKMIINDYGKDEAEKIISFCPTHNLTHIRINKKRINYTNFKELLEKNNIKYVNSLLKDAFYVEGMAEKIKSDLYTVQSASSMFVCKSVDLRNEEKLLDVCAAPGGKSVYLASLVNAEVTACDIHPHRLKLIESYAKRMGETVKVELNDATIYSAKFESKFDKVLCDVPCSGFGVLESKPDIKLFRTENDIFALSGLQLKILTNCSRYVKIGGSLIYSTCTIFKKENEEVIKNFLESTKGFEVETVIIESNLEKNLNGYIQFLPYKHEVDGFFIAKLKRIK